MRCNSAFFLSIGRPVLIGRNPSICSYTIPDIVVSNLHCKIYAVRTSSGGVLISCQDLSTNGVIINGHKIRKTSAIITNGDTIKIPASQTFQCVQRWRKLPDKQASQLAVSPLQSIKPNINRVYAVDSDSEFLYIMLQLSTGGDLFTYITTHARHRLCEGEAKYITFQLLRGLKYLHDRMISHRDLKPENILLYVPGPYPRIQIADFGLARPKAYQETLHVCGTISYLPPEGVRALECQELGYAGMPADCWSLGIVVYAMLTGSHPFDFDDTLDNNEGLSIDEGAGSKRLEDAWSQGSYIRDERTKQRILGGDIPFCKLLWAPLKDGAVLLPLHPDLSQFQLTSKAKNLICQLLVPDPQKRATVYEASKSTWIRSDLEALERAYKERIHAMPS
ncbi:hypothetical protein ID866_2949 [Astraeus odoratus]|nr:hypothetical protein ID866_2949 [Astraeus odoratus]